MRLVQFKTEHGRKFTLNADYIMHIKPDTDGWGQDESAKRTVIKFFMGGQQVVDLPYAEVLRKLGTVQEDSPF